MMNEIDVVAMKIDETFKNVKDRVRNSPSFHVLFPDIDECVIDNGGCQQNCVSLPGSYNCSCLDHYTRYQVDWKLCDGISY